MQVAILGPLQVWAGERPVVVAGALLRRLLVRLAVAAPAPVGLGELAAAVWPEQGGSTDATSNTLQSLVSRLRRALGDPAAIRALPGGYALAVPRDAIDTARFGVLAVRGREALTTGRLTEAAEILESALELFRGEPLIDAADAEYAGPVAARLAAARLDACSDLAECRLQLGRPAQAIADLEELVAVEPLREGFTRQLMTALVGAGRSAQALAAYDRLRVRLADELGVDPAPELARLHLDLLRGTTPDPVPAPSALLPESTPARTNLRSFRTSFVGRATELARIGAAVEQFRLVTVVGPGGAGKTRLATHVGEQLGASLPDGVWLVELAPVADGGDLAATVLQQLGGQGSALVHRRREPQGQNAAERLSDLLATAHCLLILDNCEHLLADAAVLADAVLAACPEVRILATSREPLGIDGEAVCAVGPLGLPAAAAPLDGVTAFPAVRLLLDRAAASGDFQVGADNLAAVIEVVRRLDGLPLAIELAAARLRVMPIEAIAARLTDRFRLLTGGSRTALPRHRTLRAVVEWSWDLLNPAERLLAERLSVFPAGATAESAAAVADDRLPADAIADLLLSLADKSLLALVPDSPAAQPRYRMLETIREYGVERLADRAEVQAVRAAHAAWFGDVAVRLDRQLRTRDQLDALEIFTAERENILAALRFLIDTDDTDGALQLTIALSWFWAMRSITSEAVFWLDATLAATTASVDPRRLVLQALRLMMTFGGPGGVPPADSAIAPDLPSWRAQLAELSEQLNGIEFTDDLAAGQVLQPMLAYFSGDPGRGDVLVTRQREQGSAWAAAAVLMLQAGYAENNGDLYTMRDVVRVGLAEFEQIGDRWGIAALLENRAALRVLDGDLDGAADDLTTAMRLTRLLGSAEDSFFFLLRLADLHVRAGRLDRAEQTLDELERTRAGRPGSAQVDLLVRAARAGVLLARDQLDEAEELVATLRAGRADAAAAFFLRGHLASLIGAISADVAIARGQIDLAAADLRHAYQEGLFTDDLPVLATTGVATAHLAQVRGHPELAARMLGAAARLRGGDDRTDVRVKRLTSALREQLGDRFEGAYQGGCALSREAATDAIDPGTIPAGGTMAGAEGG